MDSDIDRTEVSSALLSGGTMPGDLPITETRVVEFLKRFEAASATRLFANVVELIHPDALFRFNDGDYRGLEAIQHAFEGTWAHDVKDEKYTLSGIKVVSVDANSAVATFCFHWSGVGPQGPFQIAGRGTSLLVLHEGRLKVMLEHLSR
jgi:ketosteroid isomerase-like protein